jgi:DNA-binding beta-propeller fold protein YncE
VYVVNVAPTGNGTVTVFSGARCNARVTAGCGHVIAVIKVGRIPVAAVFNPRTGTIYVANAVGGTISVIDAARCNAMTRRGCGAPVKTMKDPRGPDWLDVDVATDTLYVADAGKSGNGDTVSVFNGATCNAAQSRGCGQVPHTVKVGSGPFALAVNQADGTVFVASNNDGTTSVIDGARCNARTTAGCGRMPDSVTTGPGTQFVGIDPGVHTAFTISEGDDTLSEINTRTCDGRSRSGCPKVARNARATFNPRRGTNPNAFALMPETGTAYLANVGGATILSVVSIRRCNATNTAGCRILPPSVPDHEFVMSADPVTGTLYAGNISKPQIDVINAATCNATDLTGCKPVATIPMADPEANTGAIDQATHTLYASDPFTDTVSIINTATCNAAHTAGCATPPPTVTVGPGPSSPVLDKATNTVYVPVGTRSNKVAVVNAATCNSIQTSGCNQVPALVTVGPGTFVLAVSNATDTVYAPATGFTATGDHHGRTVAVINGATCNGTNHSGCGHLAATVHVGLNPFGVDVNDATHTVYVSNSANGEQPGTVSIINGATCNGTNTAGCGTRMPTVAVGRTPLSVAVDVGADKIYVADEASAGISIINGARCNATSTLNCSSAVRDQPAGSVPEGILIGPNGSTLYVCLFFPFPHGPMALIKIKS